VKEREGGSGLLCLPTAPMIHGRTFILLLYHIFNEKATKILTVLQKLCRAPLTGEKAGKA
jgi:hypothetical protein